MQNMAIISIDGHAKASPIGYRQYFEQKFLPAYDDWLAGAAERDQRGTGTGEGRSRT